MSNSNNSEYVRLKELGKSKYEVAENESDIRGWTVKNGNGRILGKVDDLLFDVESRKVLYMVLDLEGNEMHLRDRKVLVPLSVAEIHDSYQNIVLPGIMANELTELLTYEKGKVNTRVEDLVQHVFSATRRGGVTSEPATPIPITNQSYDRNEPVAVHHSETSESTATFNQSRPQTVVGVFEHTNQGQLAVEYLLDHKFNRDQIDISNRGGDHSAAENEDHDSSVTNWFKSVFGNDDDARTYSEAARTGCVVSVHTSSVEEAETAAEILDMHGALNMHDSVDEKKMKYKSRIFDRKTESAKWRVK
jgi:hypothetical protein